MATRSTKKTSKTKAAGRARGGKKKATPTKSKASSTRSKKAAPAKKKPTSTKGTKGRAAKAKSATAPKKKGGAGAASATRKATATKNAPVTKKASAPKKRRAPKPAPRPVDPAAAATLAAPAPVSDAADMGLLPPPEQELPPVKIGKRDLAAIQKALTKIRAQLSDDVEALTQNNLTHSGREMSGDLSGYGFHMADVATDNFAREMELNIATGETDRLRLLEEAIDRLKEGAFGRCQSCTDPISVDRLKVIPYARLCIRCAEEAERR